MSNVSNVVTVLQSKAVALAEQIPNLNGVELVQALQALESAERILSSMRNHSVASNGTAVASSGTVVASNGNSVASKATKAKEKAPAKSKGKAKDSATDEVPSDPTPKQAEIAKAVAKLAGVTAKMERSWLWIAGDTKQHKDVLKSLGCYYSQRRTSWFVTDLAK